MLTSEQAPWLNYLTIDDETFESVLRDDTPKEIREKYEEYLRNRSYGDNGMINK